MDLRELRDANAPVAAKKPLGFLSMWVNSPAFHEPDWKIKQHCSTLIRRKQHNQHAFPERIADR
jgi:hypothetical protein